MAWKKCKSCGGVIPKSDRYHGLCVTCWQGSPEGRAATEQHWDEMIEEQRRSHGPYHGHIAGAARAIEYYPEDDLEEYAASRAQRNPQTKNEMILQRALEGLAEDIGLLRTTYKHRMPHGVGRRDEVEGTLQVNLDVAASKMRYATSAQWVLFMELGRAAAQLGFSPQPIRRNPCGRR